VNVTYVLESESILQNVNVHLTCSKTPTEFVKAVPHHVKDVKVMLTIVLNVLKIDSKNQKTIVHVHQDIIYMKTTVTHVTNSVEIVFLMTIVLNVLTKPEVLSILVLVYQVDIKSNMKISVHLVLSNVLNVLLKIITVLFVLIVESQDLNQHVLVIGTNMLTKMVYVKIVLIDAILVKLTLITVLLVKTLETQLLLVHVQPNGMKFQIKKLLNVIHVTQDVINVKKLKLIVLNVLKEELTLNQFQNHVHVHQVKSKLTCTVNHVTKSIVKPVT
jgi:hypothetical protein